MFPLVRRCYALLDRRARLHLLLIALLGLVVSAAEATCALLLLVVLKIATDTDAPVSVPVVGDLGPYLPGSGRSADFAFFCAAVGLAFLLRAALYVSQVHLQHRTSQGVGLRLSHRLVAGYLEMPYLFHLERKSADVIRKSIQSVTTVAGVVLTSFVTIMSEGLIVLGLLVLLTVSNPAQTAVAVLLIVPITALVLRTVRGRLVLYGRRNLDHYSDAVQTVQQGLEMIREVKVLDRARYFTSVFDGARAQYARNTYMGATLAEIPRASLETILVLAILSLVVFGQAVGSGTSDLPTLALFGYTALRVLPALNRIVGSLNQVRLSSAALDEVYADLALIDGSTRTATGSGGALPFRKALEVKDVSFTYPGTQHPVLRDVSLTVRPGESVGFVGATGAGKSTLIDLILGLVEPTAGCIRVDGVDIATDMKAWQRNVGVVPQTVVLIDDTLRRNIAIGIPDDSVDQAALARAVEMAQLSNFVESLPDGIDTRVGERGVRLSGGQRQRIAIARALYGQRSVLVFDEGTSSLDTITERELLGALDRLQGERTLITVAHRLTTVRNCDRIHVLEQGRIVDVGTYDELVRRNARFRQMTS